MTRRAILFASATLLAACSFIDDFSEFEVAGDGGPIRTDSGLDSGLDATTPRDSGVDAPGDPDTGTAMPPTCEPPCLADAYVDFGNAQGTAPLSWRYQAQPFSDPLDYYDLVQGNHRGVDGWVSDSPPPAILACDDRTAPCVAPFELLLEASASDGPVLLTTVSTTGRYSVRVTARPIGSAPTELWVSRNSAPDLVGRLVVDPAGGREEATFGFEAVQGDRIVVALRNPGGAADAIVSANVRVSSSAAPSTCEHVVTFDGDRTDACGGPSYEADGPGTLPALTAGPASYLGMAQELESGLTTGAGLIANGASIDRSGDFTSQLWVYVSRQGYVTSSIYQDWSGADSTGINLSMEDPSGSDVIEVNFLYRDPTNTNYPGVTCSGGDCDGLLSFPRPPDDRWFHLRLTRDGDTVRVCVDGAEVASTPIQPGVDMSAGLSPKVGFNFSGTPTYRIDGFVDDIRQLSEALPCAP